MESIQWFQDITSGSIDEPVCLFNVVESERTFENKVVSGVNLFFLSNSGNRYRSFIRYYPYFLIRLAPVEHAQAAIEKILKAQFNADIESIIPVYREDLDDSEHVDGVKSLFLKISCYSNASMLRVSQFCRKMQSDVANSKTSIANRKIRDLNALNIDRSSEQFSIDASLTDEQTSSSLILAVREFDVEYLTRVLIDLEIRVSLWYDVSIVNESSLLTRYKKQNADGTYTEDIPPPTHVICAYDIETTKAPLKFPDSSVDQVMMISLMFSDGEGMLFINREVVSKDIEDFDYNPTPEYAASFVIFNETNEESMLRSFIREIQRIKPTIWVTYNGDFFDWPFVDQRCLKYGLNIDYVLAVADKNNNSNPKDHSYQGSYAPHLDCFHWVQRDSYLPQGSQGLKAVTKAKLYYDPIEVPPEEMTRKALEEPDEMAQYSVSDAVATFYLYKKYVEPFIFSLCAIIPLGPDDVLRKGSGTLCEALLMVEAFRADIIFADKHRKEFFKYHKNKLVLNETYSGGRVEGLAAGIYRNDLPVEFRLNPDKYQELIDKLDRDIRFFVEVECGKSIDDVTNLDEIRIAVKEQLEHIRDLAIEANKNPLSYQSLGVTEAQESITLNKGSVVMNPLIYHLDVGAMYPNIILTNRLQPTAMVSPDQCRLCPHYEEDFAYDMKSLYSMGVSGPEGNGCQRRMEWEYRCESSYISKDDVENIIRAEKTQNPKEWANKSVEDKYNRVTALGALESQKTYRRTKFLDVSTNLSIVCQRENSFYIDTVRKFRDRRYDYKRSTASWKDRKRQLIESKSTDNDEISLADKMILLMDSHQLAHKCILNSFYGYVMRTGSRWMSMPMAGVVTYTGAAIIRQAMELCSEIGFPLELDTDGIWACLPDCFPDTYSLTMSNGSKLRFQYPATMLNTITYDRFKNSQYFNIDRTEEPRDWSLAEPQCSIAFEIDGPYKAMVLPAPIKENSTIKKRYAVFDLKGNLSELKGFEIKRRGELELIKKFQSQIFKAFLNGSTLKEAYASASAVSESWLSFLDTKGGKLDLEEALALISEASTMNLELDEELAKGRISRTNTCAYRMRELLGHRGLESTKGLRCEYIVSKWPEDASVSDRVIPLQVFGDSVSPEQQKTLFLKWFNRRIDESECFENGKINPLATVDWAYYRERLGNAILKIVSVPGGLQMNKNPVKGLGWPAWFAKKVDSIRESKKQRKIDNFFKPLDRPRTFTIDEDKIKQREINDMLNLDTVDPYVPSASEALEIIGPKPDPDSSFIDYISWRVDWFYQLKLQRSQSDRESHTGKSVVINPNVYTVINVKNSPDVPGAIVVRCSKDHSLVNLNISVPRKFYISSSEEICSPLVKPTKFKGLVKTKYMYEIEMLETEFLKHASQIERLLSHQAVLSVYEIDMTHIERFLIDVGSYFKIERFSQDLQLSDLSRASSNPSVESAFVGIFSDNSSFNMAFAVIITKNTIKLIHTPNGSVKESEIVEVFDGIGALSSPYPEVIPKHATITKTASFISYLNAILTGIGDCYVVSNCTNVMDCITSAPAVKVGSFQTKQHDLSDWITSHLIEIATLYSSCAEHSMKIHTNAVIAAIPLSILSEQPAETCLKFVLARELHDSNTVSWWKLHKQQINTTRIIQSTSICEPYVSRFYTARYSLSNVLFAAIIDAEIPTSLSAALYSEREMYSAFKCIKNFLESTIRSSKVNLLSAINALLMSATSEMSYKNLASLIVTLQLSLVAEITADLQSRGVIVISASSSQLILTCVKAQNPDREIANILKEVMAQHTYIGFKKIEEFSKIAFVDEDNYYAINTNGELMLRSGILTYPRLPQQLSDQCLDLMEKWLNISIRTVSSGSAEYAQQIRNIVATHAKTMLKEDIINITHNDTLSWFNYEEFGWDMQTLYSLAPSPSMEAIRSIAKFILQETEVAPEIRSALNFGLSLEHQSISSTECRLDLPIMIYINNISCTCGELYNVNISRSIYNYTDDTYTLENITACPVCRRSQEKAVIENRLMNYIDEIVILNQMKDSSCPKCKYRSKQTLLQKRCPTCAITWKEEPPAYNYMEALKCLKKLASYWDSELITEKLNYVL